MTMSVRNEHYDTLTTTNWVGNTPATLLQQVQSTEESTPLELHCHIYERQTRTHPASGGGTCAPAHTLQADAPADAGGKTVQPSEAFSR